MRKGYVLFEINGLFNITENFNLSEFRCKKNFCDCPYCGGAIRVCDFGKIFQMAFLLEDLRNKLSFHTGKEAIILITSATRCLFRNKEVSTVKPPENSWHWRGFAVDIIAKNSERGKLIPMGEIGYFAKRVFGEENVVIEVACVHIRFPDEGIKK